MRKGSSILSVCVVVGLLVWGAAGLRGGFVSREKVQFSTLATLSSGPRCLAADSQGQVYWVDPDTSQIKVMTISSKAISTWATLAPSTYYGIAIDSSGNIFVVDSRSIYKVDSGSRIQSTAVSEVFGTTSQFVGCMKFGSDGALYVPWSFAHVILKIDVLNGNSVTTFAGSGSSTSSTGSKSSAGIALPVGLDFDQNGVLYIAENLGRRIKKIGPDFQATVFAGSGAFGTDDGSSSTSSMQGVIDVLVDNDGNAYFIDNFASTIRRVKTDGFVETLSSTTPGFSDGNATGAQFMRPTAFVFDSLGNVVISDSGNKKLRYLDLPNDSEDSDGPNIGAIVGGTIGGLVFVIAVLAIYWFVIRKSKIPFRVVSLRVKGTNTGTTARLGPNTAL